MIDILDGKWGYGQTMEGKVIEIGQSFNDTEVMEFLLEWKGDEVQITKDAVLVIQRYQWHGKKSIKLLLDRKWNEFHITEELVVQIVGLYDKEVIEILLRQKGNEIQITEAIVIAAVRNKNSREVIKLLLNERGDEVQTTEAVVIAAAENELQGE
jgi:hypothetical protein